MSVSPPASELARGGQGCWAAAAGHESWMGPVQEMMALHVGCLGPGPSALSCAQLPVGLAQSPANMQTGEMLTCDIKETSTKMPSMRHTAQYAEDQNGRMYAEKI